MRVPRNSEQYNVERKQRLAYVQRYYPLYSPRILKTKETKFGHISVHNVNVSRR